jgi:hypothetical protein
MRRVLAADGKWTRRTYRFRGSGELVKVEGELTCGPDDFLCMQFEDTDGRKLFHHVTELADAVLNVFTRRNANAPFRLTTQLSASRSAHLEYLTTSALSETREYAIVQADDRQRGTNCY